ncbi:zinc-binding oxidoreductase [Ilyonectria robusta]
MLPDSLRDTLVGAERTKSSRTPLRKASISPLKIAILTNPMVRLPYKTGSSTLVYSPNTQPTVNLRSLPFLHATYKKRHPISPASTPSLSAITRASRTMADTMRTWQYSSINGRLEDCLQARDDVPAPTRSSLHKGMFIVEVISASINPVDYKLPESGVVGRLMISRPATPGLDFCGHVIATHPPTRRIRWATRLRRLLDGKSEWHPGSAYCCLG